MNAWLNENTGAEFFERHRRLPILLLVLLPFLLRVPFWLQGRSSDPILFVSGLTEGNPIGAPFIDPNVGFTSEALGRLAASDWVHGVIPWWNPYTGIGMPLAGELQPGAFFLPFNLLFLLPEGLLWQQIAMQMIAGLATYALLRELGLTQLAGWMGGSLFALNGVFAWSPGPAGVYCTAAFLPMLLLGVERSRRPGTVGVLIIGIATAWSILAGFPEPAYISTLPVLAWGLYRFTLQPDRWLMARRACSGLLLGILVAAPVLIAFADYLRESSSFGLHDLGGKVLPGAAFSATLMPYVYGLLAMAMHSAPLGHIWENIGGYSGLLIFLLAVVGLIGREQRGLKLVLLIWILLAFAKTFGAQPVTTLMNYLPLMKQTMFYRYAPSSWELALIILAAFGLDHFRNHSPGRRWPFGLVLLLLVIATALAWPLRTFWARPQAYAPGAFALLGISVAWAIAMMLAAGFFWKSRFVEQRRAALACLLVFDAGIMFLVPQLTTIRRGPIDVPAIQFLRDHQGLSRTYTLAALWPNYGAYFGLASVNHNVEPVPKLWADHVERNLLPGYSTHDSGEIFWTPALTGEGMPANEGERALSQHLANYLDLGVRYVIAKPGQSPVPTTILPTPESAGTPAPQRLKTLFAFLERCHAILENQAKPALQRFAAKAVLGSASLVVGSFVQEDQTNAARMRPTGADTLELQNGQSATIIVSAPTPVLEGSPITSVGINIPDSNIGAEGDLRVEICAGSTCRSGQRSLGGSARDAFSQISLNQPLDAPQGTPLRLTLTRDEGLRSLVLHLSTGADVPERIEGPNGSLEGRAMPVALGYGSALSGSRKVYADSLLDIWEVPNSAPYFQVTQGGPCTLSSLKRETVTADCVAPATLLRRELYMPGWRASLNGAQALAVRQQDIFQVLTLPTGRNHVRYQFAPPYVDFGWGAASIGIAGLLWQGFVVMRRRRNAVPSSAGAGKFREAIEPS